MQDCGKYTGGGDSLRALYDLVFFTPGASFLGTFVHYLRKKLCAVIIFSNLCLLSERKLVGVINFLGTLVHDI